MATRTIAVEALAPGMIIETRKGARLALHTVAGMPGALTLLGQRCDAKSSALEAWPIRDLAQVRIATE